MMTIRPLSFLLSRKVVVVLNAFALLICALSAMHFFYFSVNSTYIASAIWSIPPLLTCVFLLLWRSSIPLAVLVIVANALELALGLGLQLIIFLNWIPDSKWNHVDLHKSIQELIEPYIILFFSVVVPLFSVAAAAKHKPVSSGSFVAKPIASLWFTTFTIFLIVIFLVNLLGLAFVGHAGNGADESSLTMELLGMSLVLAVVASSVVTVVVSKIASLFRKFQ